MSEVWMRVIELLGFEAAEKLRRELGGEVVRIPKTVPKCIIVPIIKGELKRHSYDTVVKRYGLSECTVRRYEKWKIYEDRLVSPSGKVYSRDDGGV